MILRELSVKCELCAWFAGPGVSVLEWTYLLRDNISTTGLAVMMDGWMDGWDWCSVWNRGLCIGSY